MINNNWLAWGFKLSALSLVLSCSSSSFTDDDYGLDLQTCALETQNEFVHRAMQDRYYWYEEIPSAVNYSAYSSPNAVVDALKFSPLDRFSYVTLAESHNAYYNEGQYVGFGFGFERETGILRFVYDQSPFGQAGFKRGDKIISIDGELTSDIIANDTWGTVFGESTVGVAKTFIIEHQDTTQTSITLSKAVVTINTVLSAESFDQNGTQYAYLAFKSFINPSYDELSTAFNQFKTDNAEKLILDLRYNGGGSIAVANALASYIYKPSTNSEKFVTLEFNDKYSSEDYSFFFSDLTNTLDLNEVIILTTDATCSASEMVINSLEPFIDVTVIGSTTCGKPIGMRSQNFCSSKLVAINFQGFNSDGFGDYFNGLNADCAASDDLSFDLGDPDEPMLKAALDYDQNAANCVAPKAAKQVVKPQYYSGLKSVHQSE